MSANWWAKRLGAPPPPPRSNANPLLPRGVGQQPQQAVERYAQQHAPATMAPDPYEEPGEEAPPGQITAHDAIRKWRGDPRGAASDNETCPACGSALFTGGHHGVMAPDGRMVAPMKSCFECGYPRSQGSLDMPSGSIGPAQTARQDGTQRSGQGSWGQNPTPAVTG